MTLRPEFSLGHSKFNDFLYAVVGEEEGGIELTVLSALARLGIDPWGEAARLTGLPKDEAADALAVTIASQPEAGWSLTDARGIALNLLNHLPRPGASSPTPSPGGTPRVPSQDPNGGPGKQWPDLLKWLAWGLILATALIYFMY